ncbi:DNA internalization-related competence protein ComEC/Rec2 [Polaromonas sp.]|uniref:DNA internalization-related competence protein ComEC/Rec2 n=1 Tax=Polaromonas sp. TaxID=1869339 RepID=UPI002FCAAE99
MASSTSPGLLFSGFIIGVAVQLQQPSLWQAGLYAALAALAAALVGILHRAAALKKKTLRGGGWAVFVFAILLGLGLTGLRASAFQAQALAPALEGQDLVVTGMVLAMPQRNEDATRFRFGVESARFNGQAVSLPPQIYLGWYSGFGARDARRWVLAPEGGDPADVPLELQRQPQTLRAGERWQMTVRLKAPHGNSNPHGFDYELWLWEQGLQATGYVRAGPNEAPPRKLSGSWWHPAERARQSVREAIFERIGDRQLAGVVAALAVGDQNAIERADWDVFRATGVAHLMSISGLHITMFAWVASLLLGALWRRSVWLTPRLCLALPATSAAAWGGLLLATAYAVFSGWGVPAQRTIWMLATVVLLRQSGRQWPWPLTWLLAMTVVVALDPWALLQAGFWLSFVAVGVLFATDSGAAHADPQRARAGFDLEHQAQKRWLSRAADAALRTVHEQWVVTLALTPLSLLLFSQVSLLGLLANALAIPWVTLLVTPLALLGVLWAPLWDAAAWAVSLLAVSLQWLASWPLASISVAAAPVWCAVAGVLGGVLLAMRLPWHWRALGVPLMLPVLLWQAVRPEPGQFELLAADIGQGNAVVVRTAGHALLYDAGPRFSRDSDAGHRVLVPLLRALGERLDLLMISHRDTDHIGGAPAVLAMQPQAALSSSIEDVHELQAQRKSTRCAAGQQWTWDGVRFEVLHPLAEDYDAVKKSNAMSCVLRISNGSHTALLAGDIEQAQEQALVGRAGLNAALHADFLLMPHHGSKTSSSAVFLDAVQPRFALAQAGYRNRFGHPVVSVLERYRERGITVVKSPVCGAARWSSQQPGQVGCQRQEALRYWRHRAEATSS